MVEEATARLADLAPRVTILQGDLLELELEEPVDLIVLTATFHWILDHDALFRRLFAALVPGGRLVAQCGGAGNVAATLEAAARVAAGEPYAGALDGLPAGWLFAGPDETVARLEAAGFEDARAWLLDAPATLDDGGGPGLPRDGGPAAPPRAAGARAAGAVRGGGRRPPARARRAHRARLRPPEHGGASAGALSALGWAGVAALVAWVGVLAHPARPWDLRPTDADGPPPPDPPSWPPVAVLVPARNEAETLPRTLPALLAQDYPGPWRVVLVDDRSGDGTAAAALRAGAGDGRLEVLAGGPLPGRLGRQGVGARAGAPPRGRRAAGARAAAADRRRHPPRAGVAAGARGGGRGAAAWTS